MPCLFHNLVLFNNRQLPRLIEKIPDADLQLQAVGHVRVLSKVRKGRLCVILPSLLRCWFLKN